MPDLRAEDFPNPAPHEQINGMDDALATKVVYTLGMAVAAETGSTAADYANPGAEQSSEFEWAENSSRDRGVLLASRKFRVLPHAWASLSQSLGLPPRALRHGMLLSAFVMYCFCFCTRMAEQGDRE